LGQKILLADDSNVAQRMGKEILTGEGFEVTAVSNGQAALKKLKEYTPDLILADIFMPGASGYELCQFVKSQPLLARIPVLLLVGAMEPYDPEEGRRVRADGVITKPLQSSNLLDLVKQVLVPSKPARPKFAPPPSPAKVVSIPVTEPAPVESAPFAEATAAAVAPAPDLLPEAALGTPQEMTGQTRALLEDLLDTGAPEPGPALATPQEVTGQTRALLEDLLETGAPEPEPVLGTPEEAAEQPQVPLEDLADTSAPEAAWNQAEPQHFPLAFANAGGADAPAVAEPQPEATGWSFPFPTPSAAEEASETASAAHYPIEPVETEEPAADDRAIGSAETSSAAQPEGEGPSPSFESLSRSMQEPVPNEADEDVLSLLGEVTLAELESTGLQELMTAEPPAEAAEVPAQLVWTAETVEVTEQDKQVFAETTADWEALAQLAQDSPPLGVSALAEPAEKSEPIPAPSSEPAIGANPVASAEPEAPATQVQEPEAAQTPVAPEAPFAAVSQSDALEPLFVDPGMLERLVRESVERMMPQIVDRIVRSVGIVLRREQE